MSSDDSVGYRNKDEQSDEGNDDQIAGSQFHVIIDEGSHQAAGNE